MDDAELIWNAGESRVRRCEVGIDGGQQGRWHFPGVVVTVRAGLI